MIGDNTGGMAETFYYKRGGPTSDEEQPDAEARRPAPDMLGAKMAPTFSGSKIAGR